MSRATIEALFHRWNDALQTGDVEQVVSLYASDAILLPTVSNRVRHDHDEIADYFTHFLKKRPVGRMIEANVREFGDVAINSGVYVFALTTDDEVTDVPCRFTFVYRRQGEDWAIIEHHSSQMPE